MHGTASGEPVLDRRLGLAIGAVGQHQFKAAKRGRAHSCLVHVSRPSILAIDLR
jgi:hypothetical protein